MPNKERDEPALLKELIEGTDAAYRPQLTEADYLRFLRARKYEVSKAIIMVNNWGKWYNGPSPCGKKTPRTILDQIYDENETVWNRLCPLVHMGEDKNHCPIYYEQSGLISGRFPEILSFVPMDDQVSKHIRHMELALCRCFHLSNKYGVSIEKQVLVWDMAHLTISLDTRAMTTFKRIMDVDANYYPERLKYMILINVPWHFSALWAVIRPLLDPVTREKFVLLGSNYSTALQDYIEPDNTPTEYGGKLDVVWQWPYPEPSHCTPRHIQQYNTHRDRIEGLPEKAPVVSVDTTLCVGIDESQPQCNVPTTPIDRSSLQLCERTFVDNVGKELALAHSIVDEGPKTGITLAVKVALCSSVVLQIIVAVAGFNAVEWLYRDSSNPFHGMVSFEQLLLWILVLSICCTTIGVFVVCRLLQNFVLDTICC